MSKLIDWVLLGRKVGKASGWDEGGDFGIMLYDFEPNEGVQLPSGDVHFDFEKGTVEKYDEDGNVVEWVDLIVALANVPAVADR